MTIDTLPGRHRRPDDDTDMVRAVAPLRHPARPLVSDWDVPNPGGSGVYQHRRTWAERRDDVAITLLVLVLWVLLAINDGGPRRRMWGETRPAWEQRTMHSPAALESAVLARVDALDVASGDPDEPDVADAEPDVASPEPELDLVDAVDALVASRSEVPPHPDIAWTLHSGATGFTGGDKRELRAALAAAEAGPPAC